MIRVAYYPNEDDRIMNSYFNDMNEADEFLTTLPKSDYPYIECEGDDMIASLPDDLPEYDNARMIYKTPNRGIEMEKNGMITIEDKNGTSFYFKTEQEADSYAKAHGLYGPVQTSPNPNPLYRASTYQAN